MDISIVIICHHDRGYLQQAINSAKAQDFKGSFEIVLQMSGMTMPQNTNAGVRRAKGEYIKWLHDDDLLEPDCLTNLWTARGADVICANALNYHEPEENNFDGEDEVIQSIIPLSMNDFVEFNGIHAGTILYKRQILIDNPLDESLWTGEEYELNLRLYAKGYKFAYVNKIVCKYRIHEEMKSYSAYGWVESDVKDRRRKEIARIKDLYR
jgi:glycosyltransferase involved in cell wall biosynthesis